MNSKETIEISDDRRKLDKIRDIVHEHEGIIEQVDILKGHVILGLIEESLAQSALNKIESNMNKMTLGRITEVVKEEVD